MHGRMNGAWAGQRAYHGRIHPRVPVRPRTRIDSPPPLGLHVYAFLERPACLHRCPCSCPTTGQRTRANDQRPRPPPLVSHRPRHRLRHGLVDAVSITGVLSFPSTVGPLRTTLTYPLTHSTHRTHDGDANLAWRRAPDHTGAAITARYYTQPSRTFLSSPTPGAVAEPQSPLAGERILYVYSSL